MKISFPIRSFVALAACSSFMVNLAEGCTLGTGTHEVKINEIQGDGAASPIVGCTVQVTAIVIGDFQDGDADVKRNLKGYFLQEEDADADSDPNTSEGIFVYDTSTVNINVGDMVRVVGQVVENFEETQIKATAGSAVVLSTGNVIPSPSIITLPQSSTTLSQGGKVQPDLEAYEGMYVTFNDTLTITEMYLLGRFNEIKLVQGDRPITYTQKYLPHVDDFPEYMETVGARTITYDDGLSLQNQLVCNLDGFSSGNACAAGSLTSNSFNRIGDTTTRLTGVLYYKWAGNAASGATWRITSVKDGTVSFTNSNPRPQDPPNFGSAFKLVSGNVLNFFRTLDTGSSATTAIGLRPRGANNEEEFYRQKEKLVNAILKMDPDILGMLELENDFLPGSKGNSLEYLVDELNKAVDETRYAWVNPGRQFVDASDAISSGFLYKRSSIESLVGTAILRDEDVCKIGFACNESIFDGASTNRASIASSFKLTNGPCITVALNHLKSKGSEGTGDNADKNDGAGNWNALRLRAAQAIHAWLKTDPTKAACERLAIMGDMNSYSMEDPIKYFESVGYTDLDKYFNGDDAYSYVFDAQKGTLDYILVNDVFLSNIKGAKAWHVNSDESTMLDYNTDFSKDKLIFNRTLPNRFSDHDPMFAGFDLPVPTLSPTPLPTKMPLGKPSANPTLIPSQMPSGNPSNSPSKSPSVTPTKLTMTPTSNPVTMSPTSKAAKYSKTKKPTTSKTEKFSME